MKGPAVSSRGSVVLAVLVAVGWAWSVALLTTREHLTALYMVLAAAPPLWGLLILNNALLLVIILTGAGLGALCYYAGARSGTVLSRETRWLLSAWLVPLADLARLAGWQVPLTFVEPLFIAAITGAAVRQFARHMGRAAQPSAGSLAARLQRLTRDAAPLWLVAVWVLAIACGGWWYYDALQAYDNYLLGYNDFGHFAWRVANTWEGRGFLLETPGLPAFWDHFNPGLALLAPLWGLWPDARLFFVIQAICLALPAPLVYSIARRLGAMPGAAGAWAAAYLFYPALGQLNLNATYGWHPVSLALPLIFAAVAALLQGRRVLAAATAILACSFQEDVLVVLACLCLMMSLQAWWDSRRDVAAAPDAAPLADRLTWWGWLTAGLVLVAAFVAVFELAPFSRYQVGRFNQLGNSSVEVLLSPVLRPKVFWGTVMQPCNIYFLAALWIPPGILQLRESRRGWAIFAATLLPLAVLVAWGHKPATSIAFQYTTTLIPLFFTAAMVGATTCVASLPDDTSSLKTPPRVNSLAISGAAALATCAVASVWFGAMPWSGPTLSDLILRTYPQYGTKGGEPDREVGFPANSLLSRIVKQIDNPRSSALATGRIAPHLLHTRRLDTIAQAGERWPQFQAEVGAGRSPIELFDFVVLDTTERFYQSPEQCQFIIEQAARAAYQKVLAEQGIVVLARPGGAGLPAAAQ